MRSRPEICSLWRGIALCLCMLLVPASPSPADPHRPGGRPAVASRKPHARILLWEVSGPANPSGKVYLLGAAHVGQAPIRDFDPVIETAFARSQVLALEADLNAAAKPEFQAFIRERGELQAGTRIEDLLPVEVHGALRRALSERRLEPEAFEHFEPWLVSLMLSAEVLARFGYDARHGMGRYFLERGAAKQVVELEGARPEIELLDRLDPELQAQMLEDTLSQLDGLDLRVARMLQLWDAGDAAGLEALLFGESSAAGGRERFREQLYYRRNRSMARRLEEPLRTGQTWFGVVGAGHVVGARGIPALLAARGYRVRQLEASAPGVPARRTEP